jgi:hypothetical protein
MKVGSRVVRAGLPGIQGTVVSQHGSKVRVYWSQHFSQLVDPRKLIPVTKTSKGEHAQ